MKHFALLGTFVCASAFAAPRGEVDLNSAGKLFSGNLTASISALELNPSEFDLDRLLDTTDPFGHQGKIPEVCKTINPSDDQKLALKAAFKKHIREAIALKSELKLAAMDFMDTVENQAAGLSEGQASAQVVQDKIGALIASKATLDVAILFDILTFEQREPAVKCGAAIMQGKIKEFLEKACKKTDKPDDL